MKTLKQLEAENERLRDEVAVLKGALSDLKREKRALVSEVKRWREKQGFMIYSTAGDHTPPLPMTND